MIQCVYFLIISLLIWNDHKVKQSEHNIKYDDICVLIILRHIEMAGLFIKVILVSVMFLMLGTGLKITFREVIVVARNLKLVLLGVVSNFVVIPLFAFIGMTYLPLEPLVKVGIMLMAAAPMAPMAPMPFVTMAKGNVPYSVGLMVIIP